MMKMKAAALIVGLVCGGCGADGPGSSSGTRGAALSIEDVTTPVALGDQGPEVRAIKAWNPQKSSWVTSRYPRHGAKVKVGPRGQPWLWDVWSFQLARQRRD